MAEMVQLQGYVSALQTKMYSSLQSHCKWKTNKFSVHIVPTTDLEGVTPNLGGVLCPGSQRCVPEMCVWNVMKLQAC